jgi:hypothetical protein
MRKYVCISVLVLSCCIFSGMAEEVGNSAWGFSFSIPQGWLYQQTEEGVVLGHNTIAGMILVMPHMSSSLQEVKAEMEGGMVEEGLQLYLKSRLSPIGNNIIAGEYEGTADFQQVKAHCLGTLSPHGGGAFIIALTTPEQYGVSLTRPADSIAKSMRYTRAEASDLIAHFAGTWANYSGSTLTSVTLAPNGDYFSQSESSYSGNLSGGGAWSTYGQNQADGRWTARGNRERGTIIITYRDGSREIINYQVFVEKGQVYWNEYLFDSVHYSKQK